ncbi:hypothetical protein HID58_074796 [Brassica napus]|uniref:Uncharacterized protein n=1 Tax=Brassica napus TaxID=3708 RepID=A0ABQ7YHT9_BRANA|nr:hypothetical protein HID58_074796 [Brassica napus]
MVRTHHLYKQRWGVSHGDEIVRADIPFRFFKQRWVVNSMEWAVNSIE